MVYLFCLFYLTLLFSCGGGTKTPTKEAQSVNPPTGITAEKQEYEYVHSIELSSPEKNKTYLFGEEVTVAFKNKTDLPIDSSSITINGKELIKLGKNIKKHKFRLPEDKAGSTSIKVTSWHPDNQKGTASINIRLQPKQAPEQYDYEIVQVFPHDTKAYTQGLQYWEGYMYEGTGQYGASELRKIDLQKGDLLSAVSLDYQYFGEGITIYKGNLYQITWQSRKGFVYDLETFSLKSTFQYHSEGWGITTAGDELIMSDGTHKLYVMSPHNFNVIREIEVYDHKGEVSLLNELEYVNGWIWANVWQTDRIIAIDPKTGVVKAELHMPHLLSAAEKAKLDNSDDVLNGIAWNAEKNTFYITGKRWPKLFEIKIKDKK